MRAVEALRGAGAEVVIDDSILPVGFAGTASRVATYPYVKDGTDRFLATFGPAAYRSSDAYARAVGAPLFESSIGAEEGYALLGGFRVRQRRFDADPAAERNYHAPRRATLAAYLEPLDRLRLDGYVYPAIQMPPPDETIPQDGRLSEGPHSATAWVNTIGVPAVVVPAGFYASGLPFGLEFSGRPWKDGDLLGFAYAWEQATRLRRPPVLVEQGLLPITPARAR
jgi:Asp-tRNA(Asn)/Glu-tRNA(Gln) amidotransferase A subunit family amidase